MSRDVAEVMSGGYAGATDDVAPGHGLLSQVSDDVRLQHCCSFTCSPTVIQRKLCQFLCLLLLTESVFMYRCLTTYHCCYWALIPDLFSA